MRRWYEPRKDRPDLERSAIRKRGFVGYMDMLWREFFELLKLNLLFVLSCVPIITIPAALTAMHRITSVMVRDENHFLWPDYWKAFRRDFWKSLGGGAAIAAVMALFVLSTVFYYNLMQVNKVFVLLAGFAACVVLLTLCVSFYFFPMLAMVDLPLGALLKNSMALVFGNIGKTLLALLLFVLLIGLGVWLLPYSFIFAALIMFSFVASITTYLTYPAIEVRVMRREEGHAAGELYQTLPQQEQPEVQLRSAGLDELRFEDDETEENAEN